MPTKILINKLLLFYCFLTCSATYNLFPIINFWFKQHKAKSEYKFANELTFRIKTLLAYCYFADFHYVVNINHTFI